MFIAKLIAPGGPSEKKQFTTRKAAEDWLTGEGLENFVGDVERAELWTDGELLLSKSNAKTEDKRDTMSYRSSRLGEEEAQRAFDKKMREAKRERSRKRKRLRELGLR